MKSDQPRKFASGRECWIARIARIARTHLVAHEGVLLVDKALLRLFKLALPATATPRFRSTAAPA
eukprot:945692-Rhodomonas_salina.2